MPKNSSSRLVDEPAAVRKGGPPYKDIETLRSVDGVVGIISQHQSNGILTFAILREFEQFGQYKRTSFFPENMRESYLKMEKLVLDKLAELQKTMPPIGQRGRQHVKEVE